MKNDMTAHGARRILAGRIEQLAIGPAGAEATFVRRLAEENGWTLVHAAAVLAEYRRFLVLATTCGEEVSPSDAVDQAWHLHMVHTRGYWHGLCRDVLGTDLHHEPSSGGVERREHYRDRYARTLELYREVFEEEPPSSIWPSARLRFIPDFRRVDARRNAIVNHRGMLGVSCALLTGALAAVVLPGWALGGVLLLAAFFAAMWASSLENGGEPAQGGSGSDSSGGCGGGDAGGCGSGCGGGCGGCG